MLWYSHFIPVVERIFTCSFQREGRDDCLDYCRRETTAEFDLLGDETVSKGDLLSSMHNLSFLATLYHSIVRTYSAILESKLTQSRSGLSGSWRNSRRMLLRSYSLLKRLSPRICHPFLLMSTFDYLCRRRWICESHLSRRSTA